MELKELLDKNFTPQQIKIIRAWGDLAGEWNELSGKANYEGHGTKGLAFRFDDKILKVTRDDSEAQACSKLIGKSHPNIYETYAVARTTPIDIGHNQKAAYYLIIEEYLEPATKEMLEVARFVLEKVDQKRHGQRNKLYYEWKENYLDEFKTLLSELIKTIEQRPELLVFKNKFVVTVKRLRIIAEKLGWDARQTNLFEQFFRLSDSGHALHSMDDEILPADPPWRNKEETRYGLRKHAENLLSNVKLQHLHELALSLTYLKERGILFYDVSAGNIRSKDGHIGLIDLGYSTVVGKKELDLVKLSETIKHLQNIPIETLKTQIYSVLNDSLTKY